MSGCRGPGSGPEYVALPRGHTVAFLDSLSAAKAIVTDTTCRFFDQVGVLDMSIQLKRNYPAGTDRNRIRADYLQFWEKDVTDFSKEERLLLAGILKKAWALCSETAPDVFPLNLQLIKIKGNGYGPGVFFTRENAVVIPASDLAPERRGNLLEVMLHEVFHVYSRRRPEKRELMYRLVGFEKLPVPMDELVMDTALELSLLRNPDAMDISYAIRLFPEHGDSLEAIPVFYAESPSYDPSRKTFFEYATFHLFAVDRDSLGRFAVSDIPLSFAYNEAYYDRITDNTDYVIHPEEIVADNFVLLILSEAGALQTPLSEKGRALLEQLRDAFSD